MNTRIIFVIAFIAIFLGIASLSGVFSPPKPEPVVNVQKPVEPKVSFWVAKQTILPGQEVLDNEFEQQVMFISQAQKLHVNRDQPIRFETAMVARTRIEAGQVVVASDFSTPDSADYIALITPPGKVAYPIMVNTEDLNVMSVHPNNLMDVMLLSSPGGNVNEQQSSLNGLHDLSVSLLFKSVKVLSVNKNKEADKNSSVLVALNQDQVAKLIIARRIGQIYIYHTSIHDPATSKPFRDVMVKDVLPTYSSVRELRGASVTQKADNQGMSR
ncbi:Flp pilus assembly protein CpaB [Celerinatantimonas sp. YJH-8]|uniref:Flp pilus assembly protein CpaB n=1 Tax=Celerinatantimonas sp. YJH-8 TaxID=3228714 RepID=UPI0038CBC726